jgi:antitoxin HicB
MVRKSKHIGSSLDDFLEEENLLVSSEVEAVKRVVSYLLQQQIDNCVITKTAMAEMLGTSRSGLDRILDPYNTSITLHTLAKAAELTGKKIHITLQ